MPRRRDGSYQSANVVSTGYSAYDEASIDYNIYQCMVVETYFTDDPENLTFGNKQVTYDCIILGGRREGHIIPNCKLVSYLGGEFNYHERVLRKSQEPFQGPGKKILREQKGDLVEVTLVGRTSNPIIIGLGTHPTDETKTGATSAEGHIWREEYNGINKTITKDGDLELTRKGGTLDPKGFFTPDSSFQARMKFTEGKMIWEDTKSSLTLDKDNQTYEVLVGDKQTKILVDGQNGQVTINAASGDNQIVIDSQGEITITAGSQVSIDAPLVDVGENAVFSSTLFENLLTEFSKHTHSQGTYNVGGIPVLGISGPPTAPLISLVGSQSVKVKD